MRVALFMFNSFLVILTKKECEEILQGKDLYVKWTDPDLKDRIKRHFGEKK